MNASNIMLAAAGVGLLLNTVAVLGIAWKGGHILGLMEGAMQHSVSVLDRLTAQLDALEARVGRLEGRT